MYVDVCVCVSVCQVCVVALRDQKRVDNHLELELEAVESYPKLVLGTEFSPPEELESRLTVESPLQPPY